MPTQLVDGLEVECDRMPLPGSRRERRAQQILDAAVVTCVNAGLEAAQAEAQTALSVIQTADSALDEIGFLLRRLRSITVQATRPADSSAAARLQSHAHRMVHEISSIAHHASFNGTPLFDGGFAARQVWVGAAGQDIELDLPALDGQKLGIERPWGHANKADAPPARLISATGTLPSGIFRVDDTAVFDESGTVVGSYQDRTLDFGDGVTATFDVPVFFRENTQAPHSGTLTLNSVMSVRTPRVAESALGLVGDAITQIASLRANLTATRRKLEDAITALGLIAADTHNDCISVEAPLGHGQIGGLMRGTVDVGEADSAGAHMRLGRRSTVSTLAVAEVATDG